jgi:hypothetical protein
MFNMLLLLSVILTGQVVKCVCVIIIIVIIIILTVTEFVDVILTISVIILFRFVKVTLIHCIPRCIDYGEICQKSFNIKNSMNA